MLFIFDMGGVVTDNVVVIPRIAEKLGITESDFYRFAKQSALPETIAAAKRGPNPYAEGGLADLQRGTLDEAQFWYNFEKVSGIAVPCDYWRFYFQPEKIAGTYQLIEALRKKYRVVAGTNTIRCHYDVHNERGDYACFDKVYASHLMGIIKPDAEFWHFILEMERTPPEQTVFFDDNEDNVRAALKLGIQAHLFTSSDEAASTVREWL